MQDVIKLEEVKCYLSVFFSEDDLLINMLINTAKAYMKAKISLTEEELNKHQIDAYKSCIFAIVYELYNNRGQQVNSSKTVVTQSTNKLIEELCMQILFFL